MVENVCRGRNHGPTKHIDFASNSRPKIAGLGRQGGAHKDRQQPLINALKYAQSYARLKMTVENDPARFRVTVVNDGPVVPEGMREKIFQPFMQYRDGKHVIAGTGIGGRWRVRWRNCTAAR